MAQIIGYPPPCPPTLGHGLSYAPAGPRDMMAGISGSRLESLRNCVFDEDVMLVWDFIRAIGLCAVTGVSKSKPMGKPYERVAARGTRGIGGSFEAEMPRLIIRRKFSEDNIY